MALLGDAVLEHDHRAHDLLALDVRDVEALDPDRQRLEVERLAQLFERLDASGALALGDEGLRFERKRGVLLRELLQPALLATLGYAHLDARAAPCREELGQRRCVADAVRYEDLRRDRRRAAVVLEAKLLEHLGDVLAGRVLEVERVAVDHPAVPQREHLHRGALGGDRDPDHVDRADRLALDRLALGETLDRAEPVPVTRRVLEPLVGGRLLHLLGRGAA